MEAGARGAAGAAGTRAAARAPGTGLARATSLLRAAWAALWVHTAVPSRSPPQASGSLLHGYVLFRAIILYVSALLKTDYAFVLRSLTVQGSWSPWSASCGTYMVASRSCNQYCGATAGCSGGSTKYTSSCCRTIHADACANLPSVPHQLVLVDV